MSTLAGTGGLSLERPPRFGAGRRLLAVAGVLALVLAWWQLRDATADVEVTVVTVDATPVTLLVPTAAPSPLPGVVVAHGFAGSAELMRSFALAFVDAGYAVALPDLAGHGRNAAPLGDPRAGQLADEVLVAVDTLVAQERVDGERVVLLGHSMGSGAVMEAGLRARPEVAGVIAVSPTDAAVDSSAPPDLLLLAGSGEPRFVANAEDLLDRAGGAGGTPGTGRARAFEEIDGVEHVSILFSPAAHAAAVAWADAVLDRPEPSEERAGAPAVLLWWAVGLVGVLVAWRAVVPLLRTSERLELPRGRPVVGLLLGAVVATLGSSAVDAVLDLGAPGGMAVAPLLVVWFLLAGSVWMAVGARPGAADARDPVWAVVLLLVLVVGVGWLASSSWLPFLPLAPPRRAAYVLPFLLALLPWTLAFASALQDRRGPRALGWWVLVSAVLLLTLGATSSVVAGLGFLALVLPLLPLVLGLTMLVTHPVQRPWAAGLTTAAFLAWLLAVLFPLT